MIPQATPILTPELLVSMKPQDGEAVISCLHPKREGKLHYIGRDNGLPLWIKAKAGDFWCRWVFLCHWCEGWRRLRRKTPLEAVSKNALKGSWRSE